MLQLLRNVIVAFNDPEEFKQLLLTKRVGIYNFGPGIGDHVHYTFWPEIYYENTGKKLVDLNKKWCYDYNPFVERDKPVDIAFCPWELDKLLPKKHYLNAPEQVFSWLNFKVNIRHPRLYRFEDIVPIPGTVCVNTTGKSMHTEIPDKVIDLISETYRDYQIFQVGGINDRNTPFIDRRGLGMWNTAELIAKSQIFIGVNSGMMHIADCYPRVCKKILIDERSLEELKQWWPCSRIMEPISDSHWLNTTMAYYNYSDNDIGITYTWRKI